MARRSRIDRRREIALAMKQVAAVRGIEGASIVEVARAAGMAPGLVHYHFTDKEELLRELLEVLRLEVRERVAVRLAQVDPGLPDERLMAYLDAVLATDERADAAAVACWVALGAEALRPGPMREPFAQALREQLEAIETLVSAALPNGTDLDVRSIASSLLAAVHGYFVLATTSPGLVPRGSAAAAVKEMAVSRLAMARARRAR